MFEVKWLLKAILIFSAIVPAVAVFTGACGGDVSDDTADDAAAGRCAFLF
jgi:hypothetical protein